MPVILPSPPLQTLLCYFVMLFRGGESELANKQQHNFRWSISYILITSRSIAHITQQMGETNKCDSAHHRPAQPPPAACHLHSPSHLQSSAHRNIGRQRCWIIITHPPPHRSQPTTKPDYWLSQHPNPTTMGDPGCLRHAPMVGACLRGRLPVRFHQSRTPFNCAPVNSRVEPQAPLQVDQGDE